MWIEIGIALLAATIVLLLLWFFTSLNQEKNELMMRKDKILFHQDGDNKLAFEAKEGVPKTIDELDWDKLDDIDFIIMSGDIPLPKTPIETRKFILQRPPNYDFANMVNMRTMALYIDADFTKLKIESLEELEILDAGWGAWKKGFDSSAFYEFITKTKPLSIECRFLVPTHMFNRIIEMDFLREVEFSRGVADVPPLGEYPISNYSNPHIDYDKIDHLNVLSIGYESKLNKSRRTTLLSIL